MAKKYPMDLTKHSILKKRSYLTLNKIEQELQDNGYEQEEINLMKDKINTSQYIFGNFDSQKLIDVNKNLRVITSSATVSPQKQKKEIPNLNKKMAAFKSLIADIREHTRGTQTPDQLIRNAQEVVLNYSNNPTKLSTSIGALMDSYEKYKKIDSYLYFDTEVFGGENEYGKQGFLGLQEFTISSVNKNNGNPIVNTKKSILFGLDKDNDKETLEQIYGWIDDYKATGELPSEGLAKITLDRLAREGHSKTQINYTDGIATIKSFASSEDIGEVPSVELILKGLEKEFKVAEYNKSHLVDEDTLGKETIPKYIDTFYSMIADLNNNFVLGKNNINADTNWINAYSAMITSNLSNKQKRYIANKYGENAFSLMYDSGVLDQENAFRASTSIRGLGEYYTKNNLEFLNQKKLTPGSLEAIGLTFFPELYKSGAAHTASIDNIIGANYASKAMYENGKSLMEKQLDDIAESYPIINRAIQNNDDNVPLLLAKSSDMYGRKDFDFTYNQALDVLHFSNGKTVNNEGDVNNVIFSPGTKKGVTYSPKIYEFMPDEKMSGVMKNLDYRFKSDAPLYLLELTPELNKDITLGNKEYENRFYRIFTSLEEAGGYVSSNFLYYADKTSDGYVKLSNQKGVSKEIAGMINKATALISHEAEGIKLQDTTVEEIIEQGTFELVNDSAIRSIRNNDFKKVGAFFDVRDYFAEKGVKDPGKVREYLSAITALNISNEVAKGKDLTLDLQQVKSDLIHKIGFMNQVTEKQDIFPNTLRNFQTTYGYYSSYENTLEKIYRLSSKAKNPQLAYQTYSTKLRNDIANKITNNKELYGKFKEFFNTTSNFAEEELVNGVNTLKTFGFDTNYFDFELPENFFKKTSDTSIRFNLEPRKHYSLTKRLLEAQHGKSKVANMNKGEIENYGKHELVRFINKVNHAKDTKGIFADTIEAISGNTHDILLEDIQISNADLSEMLFNNVREFREKNPFSGYKKDRKFFNALSENYVIKFAESIDDGMMIENSIADTTRLLSKVSTKQINAMTKENVNDVAKEIVDNILNKSLGIGNTHKDLKELAEFASNTYGHNKSVFGIAAGKTYADQLKIVRNIIQPILTRGGSIIENDGRVNVTFNNVDFLDISEYLPYLQFNSGRLDTVVGNSTIMTGTRLSVEDAISPKTGIFDKNRVKFVSGLDLGAKRLRGLSTNIDMSIQNGSNPLDMVLYTLKNMAESIRQNPQSSRGNTISEMISSVTNVNVEEVISGLPYIYEEIMSSDLFDNETKEVLKKAMPGIKNGFINADVYQIIGRNIQNFIKFEMGIYDEELDPIKTDQYIIKNLNLLTRDTAQAKFIYKIGDTNPSALHQLSNYQRPVPIQKTNARNYDKDKLAEYINIVGTKDKAMANIDLKDRLTTISERRRVERKIGHTNTISKLGVLKTNIDDTTYHKIIAETYEKIIKDIPEAEREAYERAFEIASGFSLYEGEKIINPRLGGRLFNNADTQYIKINKDITSMLVQAQKDHETNRRIMQKQATIIPFVKVSENGVVSFSYGNEEFINKYDTILTKEGFGDIQSEVISKNDGFLKFRYYAKNSDIEISDKVIEKELRGNHIYSIEDAISYLNEKYTPMFTVESLSLKGFNKLYLEDEKGMARFAGVGAGLIDERIKNVFKEVGFESLTGSLVKPSLIEKRLKDMPGIEGTLGLHGFNSLSGFIDALNAEQNFIVDNIFSKIPGFEKSVIFTNDNLKKHDNVAMYIKDMINTAARKKSEIILAEDSSITREKALNRAYKEINETISMSNALWGYTTLDDEDNGQILFTNSENPITSKNALKDLQGRLDVSEEDGYIYDKNGVKYSVSAGSLSVAGPTEFAGTSNSIKDLKNIDNELFELQRKVAYASANNTDPDERDISRIKELTQRKYNLQNLNKYMTIDARSMDTLTNQKYTSPEEMAELKRLWNSSSKNNFDSIFGDLFDDNLNLIDRKNANVNKAIIDNIESKLINDDEILENNKSQVRYELNQAKAAMEYNADPNSFIDESFLTEKGFKEVSLDDDMFIPSGAQSPDLINQEKSLLEKNLIVDIGDRKIAVPYEKASIVGDQVINTERNKKLRSVSRYYNIIQENKKGNNVGDKPLEYYQEKLNESVQDLLQTLKVNKNALDKEIRTVRLDGYTFSKLSGVAYHKGLIGKFANNPLYRNAEFMGESLGSLAKKGIHINAGSTGLKFFEEQTNLFEKDTLKKLGKTREGMIEHLKKNGTMGIFTRNPNTEKGSTTPMMLYLDDTNNTDKINLVAELLGGVQGDVDGDIGALSLIKFGGKDYATAMLEGDATSINDWDSAKRAIAYTALPNSRIRKGVDKTLENDIKNNLITIDDLFGEEKYKFGLPAVNYDSKELRNKLKLSRDITNQTIERLGTETFNSLNESQTYDALIETVNSYDEMKRKEALGAINVSKVYAKRLLTNMSNSNKADIGFMDTPMNELIELNKIINGDNSDAINEVIAVSKTLREKPISRKKSTDTKVSITNAFRETWNRATRGSQEDANKILTYMDDYKDDIVDYLKEKTSYVKTGTNEELYANTRNRVRDILTTTRTNKNVQRALEGARKSNYSNIESQKYYSENLPFGKMFAEMTNKIKISEEDILGSEVDLGDFQRRTAKKLSKQALDGGEQVIEGISHGMSGLGKGALGLAAAIMVAGYVGGNPTKPADTQAEEVNNDEYESLQDKDLQIQQLPQGTSQGYVININATSNRGKKHVQEAIQKAMQSSIPTDVNIQMNIADKTSNITTNFIDKLLTGAL